MGFSNMRLQDTDENIMNEYCITPTKLKILAPYGVMMEDVVSDGYHRYGGKDYFEMVAEMNGYVFKEDKPEYLRDMGLDLFYNHEDSCVYPKLVSMDHSRTYVELSNKPVFGDNQGYDWSDIS